MKNECIDKVNKIIIISSSLSWSTEITKKLIKIKKKLKSLCI